MKTLVIGVGNDYRGDDAIGLLVARRIRDLQLPDVQVIESDGECAKLMESWKGAEKVILIDAVHSGAAPGTIHRVTVHEEELPVTWRHGSTHAFGVAEAIALSKAMQRLPRRIIVFGVEARSFVLGEPLSDEVTNALKELSHRVQQEVTN